jgi:hypothetical protein
MPKRTAQPAAVPAQKEVKLQIRLDAELHRAALKRASEVGSLSAVIRALLRKWLDDGGLTDDDILREMMSAPHQPRRRSKL